MDVLGREDEQRSIDGFLDRPDAAGLALVLEGDAGIGKSTLWLAGVEAARERGSLVLSAQPAELELGVAYAGLADVLEATLGEVLSDLATPRRRALEAILLVDSEADAESAVEFRTVAVAVRSALELLASRGPVLVAIDDVQWLDASSANALGFALRRLPAGSLRLLLARRIGDGASVSELELAIGGRGAERLLVGPLSVGALHAILQRKLGRVFARPTLLRVHEASGGNPFFALELARALPAEVDPTQPLPVPESLETLVRSRLANLPPATRASLLVACAHPRIGSEQLDQDALEPAFAEHVIELAGGAIRFTHPLLASVLYQSASPQARRGAHARAAGLAADPLARARHLALAAVEPDAGIAAELERSAGAASARGAPILAAELGEHALRATPRDAHADRRRRAIATARAHLAAGEGGRPRAIAFELIAEAAPGPERAEALTLLAEFGSIESHVALLEEALRDADGHPELQASLHRSLAGFGRFNRGWTWAVEHARVAVELAEQLGDDALLAGATALLAALRFDQGDVDAPRLADRAFELATACGDQKEQNEAAWALAHVLVWSVDTERARALLEAQHRDWQDRDEFVSIESLWYLALVEFRAGRWPLAAQHAERAWSLAEQYESVAPQNLYPVALIAAHQGDLERARELGARARELATEQGAFLPSLAGLEGTVQLWSGDPASAEPWFAVAEEQADVLQWGEPNRRSWRGDYIETLLELGRTEEAESVLEAWERDAARVRRVWVLAQTARCRGLLAAACGEIDSAVAAFEAAVAKHDVAGDPFGRARTLLALGVVRRRARQKRAAREATAAALEAFEALGAAGWAKKASRELGTIGGRTRQGDLTAAERRVASLAAEGRTNREVAAMLFLAERTVGNHLSHVYAKLGVRSRTELARKRESF